MQSHGLIEGMMFMESPPSLQLASHMHPRTTRQADGPVRSSGMGGVGVLGQAVTQLWAGTLLALLACAQAQASAPAPAPAPGE